MIGYYAHHRGAGHVQRAAAIASQLTEDVTVLSSSPPDPRFANWIELAFDHADDNRDVTANGTLHWVPLGSHGLRSRMATISDWIVRSKPSVMVVDVSVEVVALARLHGIPVVTIAQPGMRDDAAHTLGYRLASAIIAPWPASIRPSIVPDDVEARFEHVGAISRFPVAPAAQAEPGIIGVLAGYGTRGPSDLSRVVEAAHRSFPAHTWITPASSGGVAEMLSRCGLVFTHAGQNAIAEVAAFGVPAIVVAEDRPHDEQRSMARALDDSEFPVSSAVPGGPVPDRPVGDWAGYVDGSAAQRAARVIESVAL